MVEEFIVISAAFLVLGADFDLINHREICFFLACRQNHCVESPSLIDVCNGTSTSNPALWSIVPTSKYAHTILSAMFQECLTYCIDKDATFMATQYGEECWCSNEEYLIHDRHGEAVCDYPCSGNEVRPYPQRMN